MAFKKGTLTCRQCIQHEEHKAYIEDGVITYQNCLTCGESKNKFEAYGKNNNDSIKASCRECFNTSQRTLKNKYHGRSGSNYGFIMDGKRYCKTCDTIKDKECFYSSKVSCRLCLGMTDRPRNFITRNYEPISDDIRVMREHRLSLKKQRQEEFVYKFHEYIFNK